jgi:hypothetical protein
VLVVGIFLADQPNFAAEIMVELERSRQWAVEQRWFALGQSSIDATPTSVTVSRVPEPTPKFTLINRLLRDVAVDDYAFVLVCDDDIDLPPGFLDAYLAFVERYDLALAQPARTADSYVDHHFVTRLNGISARLTRFVEIGPFFSVRKDAVPLIMPFDEDSPMGWGYDLAWPLVISEAGLRMGIVDAVPVRHTLRMPVSFYAHGTAASQMQRYLSQRRHLPMESATVIVESYV